MLLSCCWLFWHFRYKISLGIPFWNGTHSVDKAGLKLLASLSVYLPSAREIGVWIWVFWYPPRGTSDTKRRIHGRMVAWDPAAFVHGDRRLGLKGLKKKLHFCELKTSIYPVSGVFCTFSSEAWRKTLSSVFCLVQGRECTSQFQPLWMVWAAAGKDNR